MANAIYDELSLAKVRSILDWAKTFKFKDDKEADKRETLSSINAASIYVTGKFGLSSSGLSEEELSQYILDYEANTKIAYASDYGKINFNDFNHVIEQNSYFARLYVDHGVPIELARTSKHNEIIWSDSELIDKAISEKFIIRYNANCLYFYKNLMNDGNSWDVEFNNFIKLFIVFHTINDSISSDMENVFDIDNMDEYSIKNLLYSYNIDFLDDLGEEFQRKILRNIRQLLYAKGTDSIFTSILGIFGFDNVDAYRYYLVKKYPSNPETVEALLNDTPNLMFARIPYAEKNPDGYISRNPNNSLIEYNGFVDSDPLWKVSSEEILTKEFNYIQTKYFDIETAVNLSTTSSELSVFYELLKDIKIQSSTEFENISFVSNELSSTPINLFDGLTGLYIMAMGSIGYELNAIPSVSTIAGNIKRFRATDSLVENVDYFSDYSINNIASYLAASQMSRDSIDDLLVDADEAILFKKKFADAMNSEEDMVEYKKMLLDYESIFVGTANKAVFGSYTTYEDYMTAKCPSFFSTIKSAIDSGSAQTKNSVFNSIIDAVSYVLRNTNGIKVHSFGYDQILLYIEKLINYFKSYTIQLGSLSIYYVFDESPFNKVKLFDENQKDYSNLVLTSMALEPLKVNPIDDSVNFEYMDDFLYNISDVEKSTSDDNVTNLSIEEMLVVYRSDDGFSYGIGETILGNDINGTLDVYP